MKDPNVLLCSFSAEEFTRVAYLESLVGLLQHTLIKVTYRHRTREPIHVARRRAVDEALAGTYTHLGMVDDDQIFPPETLDRLIKHDVDVVSALAYQRKPPYQPCIFMWCVRDLVLHTEPQKKRGLQRVDATGFPFVVIKTEALRKLDGDYFGHWLAKGQNPGGEGCGEDTYFCARCRDKGIPVHCDTSLVVGHLGPSPVVDEKTYVEYKTRQISEALKNI